MDDELREAISVGLRWVGLVFTSGGLLLAGWGIRETRIQYDPQRLGIVGTIGASFGKLRFRLSNWWRRVRGKTNKATVPDNASTGTPAVGTPSAFLAPGPPKIDESHRTRIADLEEQVRDLYKQSIAHGVDLLSDRGRIDELEGKVWEEFSAIRGEMRAGDTELATGGLRDQTVGLVLAAVGTIFSFVGDLMA